MGQAKQRGSFAQRQAAAPARQSNSPSRVWAIIVYDRSSRGKNLLTEQLRQAQKPLAHEITSSMNAFVQGKGQFMVYARHNQAVHGHLLYASDVQDLTGRVFQHIATELMDEGDKGNFILAVDVTNEDSIRAGLKSNATPG